MLFRWIGSVMLAHTNLTKIKSALDLMWRAGVQPSDVVLGIGFYGRSYTMLDTSCFEPGCSFASSGTAGSCTDSAGVLSYKEIMDSMEEEDVVIIWDETDAVNYMTWDQDTYDWQALSGLLGKTVSSSGLLTGGSMDTLDAETLSQDYSAYTGTDCYISDYVDWNTSQCKTGYSVLDYVHQGSYGMIEDPDKESCKTGNETDTNS
ncbi:hypothetical protein N7495_000027 [Penicillium taxi]|uniref:uncharacterized protein n=1 Tax=Penicillium taxi TaxID=168475 RepID=UPI002545B1AF|nr:uncharacterized protein N7495_000027 [Penicillium taxi]KAJ5907345.1 hypothetical protein N7495_000027 [Penicillium taxi]